MAITKDDLVYAIKVQTEESNRKLDVSIKQAELLDASMKQLDAAITSNSKVQMEYAKALERANYQSELQIENISKISSKLDSINTTSSIDQVENLSSSLESMSNSLALLSSSTAIAGLKKIYEIIIDPRFIQAAEDILVIMQAMATVKGFDKLASSIEIARKKMETLAEAMAKFRDAIGDGDIFGKINQIAEKSRLFLFVSDAIGALTKSLVATIVAMSGYSIFGTISKEGLNFQKILIGLKETFQNAFQTGMNAFKGLSANLNLTKINMGDLVEMLSLFSSSTAVVGVLTMMSEALGGFDVVALKASAASLGLTLAIKGLIMWAGAGIESVGESISSFMDEAGKKFEKSQAIMSQFGFVIKNFGAAYGSSFIGDIKQWSAVIQDLAATTVFSMNDLTKSTKLVIAENKALGLSYDENVKFLRRAVEIAASSGMELFEVVQRLQSALTGNTQAVAALGINLGQHAIEHSELNKEMQKTIGNMTEQEKKQIALAEIYKQTEPLVGSSIVASRTLLGINQQLTNSYDQINSKIGSVNVITIALKSAYADLVKVVENMPDIFYSIAGGIADVSGITLEVAGATMKWLFVLTTLTGAYKVFNAVLVANTFLQTKLNELSKLLGLTFAFQATQITTASSVISLFGKVLKGSFLLILNNVKSVIISTTKTLAELAFAVVTNPLFLEAAAIAAGVFLLIKAFDEINKEMTITDDISSSFEETFVSIKDALQATGKGLQVVFGGMVSTVKILIVSIMELYQAAKLGYYQLQKIFQPGKAVEYDKEIDAVLGKLDTLAQIHTGSLNKVASVWKVVAGNTSAQAMTLDRVNEKMDEFNFKQNQLKKAADAVDYNTIRIEALGTEVEKLKNRYIIAAKSVEKFSDEIMNSSEISSESLKDYQKALEEQAKVAADIDKSKIDNLKEVAKVTDEVNKEVLRLTGDETKQINSEFNERIKSVKELETALAGLGPIAGQSAKKIIDAYKAIEAGRKAALKASQDKKEQEANELQIRLLKEQNDLLDTITKKNRDLTLQALGDSLTEHEKINEMLKYDTAEIDKQISNYKIQWGAQSEIVKALEQQKKLLVEVSDVQKTIWNMELPDWISAFGNSINELFGKEKVDDFFKYIKEKIDEVSQMPIVMEVKQKAQEVASNPDVQGVSDVIAKGSKAFMNMNGSIISALSKAGGWIGQAIDVIMNAEKYLRAMIDFPKQFLAVIKSIPGLMKQVIDTFPDMIRKIADALPAMALQVVNMIPSFVDAVIDGLPTLVERMAEILPTVMVKLLGMMPRLYAALTKGTLLVVQGFVKGLIRGLGELLKGGVKLPQVQVDPASIENAVKKFSGSSSRLFQVNDLAESVKGPIQEVTEQITEAFDKGRNWLKEAWQWVYDTIFKPIIDGIRAVWTWVNDNIFSPVANAFKSVFGWVLEKIIDPLATLGQKLAEPIISAFANLNSFFQSIGATFSKLFNIDASGASEAIKSAFTAGGNILMNAFKAVINPFVDVANGLIYALNKMKIPEIGYKISAGKLGSWSGTLVPEVDLIPGDLKYLQKLAAGGMVQQGAFNIGGAGTDTALIAATPGEFMVNRRGVQAGGLDMLSRLNQGISPASSASYNINFEINIDAKTTMDEGYIRGTLIPRMQDELKRASLDGRFVISQRGIR